MKTKAIAANTKRSSLQRRTINQFSVALLLVAASFAQSPDGALHEDKSGQSTSASTTQVLVQESPSKGKQSNHILWVIPNYRAVSANTRLDALSSRAKFKLATEDSFDYSSLSVAGLWPA